MTATSPVTYRRLLRFADQPIHRFGSPSFEDEPPSNATSVWRVQDVPYDQFPRGLSRWPDMVDTLIAKLQDYANSDAFTTYFPNADQEIQGPLRSCMENTVGQMDGVCDNEESVRRLAGHLADVALLWLKGANPTVYAVTRVRLEVFDINKEKRDKLKADLILHDKKTGLLYIDCKRRGVLAAHNGYEDRLISHGFDQFTRPPDMTQVTGYQSMFGKTCAINARASGTRWCILYTAESFQVTYRMEPEEGGPYLLISERHQLGKENGKSLFLVMMAVILLREEIFEYPEHTVPESLGPRPTLSMPPQLITPIQSVNLLRHAPSLFIKYHFKDVPYQATLTFHRTHPPPSTNPQPDPNYPPVLLTKLLDYGVTGVVYLAWLGYTAIAAKQALPEGMDEIAHEADIYLLLNATKISGRGIPIYFGTFVHDDATFMLTSYCGNSFGTWQQMWLLQLLHARHILLQLHRLGVCHGDVHPGNIVRDWWGRVSVVDFASATTLSDHGCECYQRLDETIRSRFREIIPNLFFFLIFSSVLVWIV